MPRAQWVVPQSAHGPALGGAIPAVRLLPFRSGAQARILADPLEQKPSTVTDLMGRDAGPSVVSTTTARANPALREAAAYLASARLAPPADLRGAEPPSAATRWSGDGWLAWRAGSPGRAGPGPITPVYGGSQAGAVLRYALAPSSQHHPAAYVRAVSALGGARESDIAAGLAMRPLPGLPLTAHGEARLVRRGDTTTVRPAVFLSGGVEAAPLAAGFAARGYVQAGYVGGRDATAFADASLIAERPAWRGRDNLLTAGAGVWGGAQRGAERVDLGPTASLRFRLGEGTVRISADYRMRIAGNAQPASGAALTLGAGF